MTDHQRRAGLAARQAELLDALVGGGPAPEGFERDRLWAQARALVAKRRAVLSKQHPELAEHLGERFVPLFQEFCDQQPPNTAPGADARAFREWLARHGVPVKRTRWRWRRR